MSSVAPKVKLIKMILTNFVFYLITLPINLLQNIKIIIGATPAIIKTNLFLTPSKNLNNTQKNLKDKGKKLDTVSTTQLSAIYLSQ